MGICDTLDDWDDIGPSSERFTELRDFVDDLLSEWGFDPPNWSDQPHPEQDGAPGMYDSRTRTIHLDPDFLGNASASDAVNVAIHEGLHAGIDQAGWDLSNAAEEWEAASLGIGVGQDLNEGCKNPTESGAPGDMPDYPWISRGE